MTRQTPSSGAVRIAPLRDRGARDEAADLVTAQIPHVARERVFTDDDSPEHAYTGLVLMRYTGTELPKDVWLGAWSDGELVGALHAGVHVGQASNIGQAIASGHPNSGSPDWLDQYVRRCVIVDEVAVAPAHQGQGIGFRLVASLHGVLESDATREARHVIAHACSDAAIATFRGAGYTIGPPSTPVPAAYAEGLPTLWDPEYDVIGGAWAYRHVGEAPRDGASFFRPGTARIQHR
ncbi:GNAT family N-acetyltransferase [Isoptericola sp. NPDC055881]